MILSGTAKELTDKTRYKKLVGKYAKIPSVESQHEICAKGLLFGTGSYGAEVKEMHRTQSWMGSEGRGHATSDLRLDIGKTLWKTAFYNVKTSVTAA